LTAVRAGRVAVIEHIDRNPDSTLDLATLSGVAHFSEFQSFARVSHAIRELIGRAPVSVAYLRHTGP
jgi:hypothetical protein